jgi:hypothetical protein
MLLYRYNNTNGRDSTRKKHVKSRSGQSAGQELGLELIRKLKNSIGRLHFYQE